MNKSWEGKWDEETIECMLEEFEMGGINGLMGAIRKHVYRCPWNSYNQYEEWCLELYDFVMKEALEAA